MRNLVIDIGNSNVKFGVFEGQNLLDVHYNLRPDAQEIKHWLREQQIETAIISDVKNNGKDWELLLDPLVKLTMFDTGMSAGLISEYETQQTLGQDRWAKIIAVSFLNKGGDSLVIDGGSCLTVDFLEAGLTYKGGIISPGVQMRFNALNQFTGNLPLVNWDEDFHPEIGRNTEDAIRAGVLRGIQFEVEGYVQKYIQQHKGLKIYFSGGNASLLWSQLKNSIFAPQFVLEPFLVLKGLNEVI